MTNTVLIKRSGTANSVPTAGQLANGEIAINYADGNLFFKDSGNTVRILASTQFVSVTGNVTGNYFVGNANIQYTASTSPPASGNLYGAQWYNTSTDTLYEYQSDGTTLYWVDITGPVIGSTGAGGGSGSSISNGTSNVTVAANANTTVGVAGTTIVTVASTGEYVTGIVSATGNITGSYFIGNGSQLTGISGGGGGNITFSNTAPVSPAAGDTWIQADTAIQYVYFNDGTSDQWAEMEAAQSFSTGGGVAGSNTQIQFNDSNTAGASANLTFNSATNTLSTTIITATGNITGGNLNAGGLSLSSNVVSAINSTANITTTANIAGNYFIGNGSLLTGTSITIKEEGSNLTTAVQSIDFVGGGVTATNVGNAVTVTVPTGTTRAQAMTMSILFGG